MNLLESIAPKSDQLNADDLIGGPKTVQITKVSAASGEQPIAINYEGDNGKPYMPCKSMRRVLVHCWGDNGHKFVGRSMTLYRDEKVIYGGIEVGGIRISHMSDISGKITMALTANRKSRKPFVVNPLVVAKQEKLPQEEVANLDDWISDIKEAGTMEALGFKFKEAQKLFKGKEQRDKLVAAKDERKAELTQESTPAGEEDEEIPL